jgi:hypothetical protein
MPSVIRHSHWKRIVRKTAVLDKTCEARLLADTITGNVISECSVDFSELSLSEEEPL